MKASVATKPEKGSSADAASIGTSAFIAKHGDARLVCQRSEVFVSCNTELCGASRASVSMTWFVSFRSGNRELSEEFRESGLVEGALRDRDHGVE